MTCEEFWNKRSRVFDSDVSTVYQDAYDKTAEHTLRYLKPTDRVLDYACGTGIPTLAIAPHVKEVRGIDISMEMVIKAQNKAAEANVQNVIITNTGIFDPCLAEGSFDAITAFNLLLYVEDLDQVLARVRSLLKPEGMFLSATDCLGCGITKDGVRKFIRSHTGRMPYVAFFKMEELVRRIEDAGFTVLEQENLHPAPPNLFIAARK